MRSSRKLSEPVASWRRLSLAARSPEGAKKTKNNMSSCFRDTTLGGERPVVLRLLNEHPYTLFVFSNSAQDRWHFLNVKYDETSNKRRLFRRITVGPYERLRTASERIAMLDLEAIQPDLFGLSPLAIQQRCDEAFDVEAVTKQFFEEYKAVFGILQDD